jgi:hypothetical protein
MEIGLPEPPGVTVGAKVLVGPGVFVGVALGGMEVAVRVRVAVGGREVAVGVMLGPGVDVIVTVGDLVGSGVSVGGIGVLVGPRGVLVAVAALLL